MVLWGLSQQKSLSIGAASVRMWMRYSDVGQISGRGRDIPPWVDQSKWWRDEPGGGATHQEHTQ